MLFRSISRNGFYIQGGSQITLGVMLLVVVSIACNYHIIRSLDILFPHATAFFEALVDAALRARKMRNKMKLCTFSCADLGHDGECDSLK